LGLEEAEKREKFSVKKVKQRPLQAFPNWSLFVPLLCVQPALFILVHTRNLNLVKQSTRRTKMGNIDRIAQNYLPTRTFFLKLLMQLSNIRKR